ncbi:hypothetical protein E6R60_05815 [Streptomyces sp. A0642]|uniref:hypothetical protein n=1 Tax=Streptomyces sp. A0642 TaxID=2563100 RepID=UPI0010A23AC6|nr:hypothetical protein [Streptomyces sp. A0642]THA78400.1 hypothetical protein E6R60_05815 [Streptomyces sp. A0642]
MRTRTTAIVTAGLLLTTLTACGSSDKEDTKVDTPKPPAYTVANKKEKTKTGSADLVIPNATVAGAKAAIQDYAKTIDGLLNYSITVVRSNADKTYVCRGEWVKDEQAAEIYTGGRITSDTWPALDMNCPDPKGS